MPDFIHECKFCKTKFITDNRQVKYCSKECANGAERERKLKVKRLENEEKYKDVDDIPTCKICGFKATSLIRHLRHVHKISQKGYMRKYRAKLKDIYHPSVLPSQETGIMIPCANCGKEFEKKSHNSRFCSPKCKRHALYEASKTRKEKIDLSKPRTLNCKQCNKEFTTSAPKALYCSIRCRDNWKYENIRKKGKTRSCLECGKEYPTSHKRYCSIKCRSKARKRRVLEKLIEKSNEMYGDRDDIPTCKVCGYRSKSLIKHIKSHHNMTKEQYYRKFNATLDDLVYMKSFEHQSEKNRKIFEAQCNVHLKQHYPR